MQGRRGEVRVGSKGGGGEGTVPREEVWERVVHGREKGFADCESCTRQLSEERYSGVFACKGGLPKIPSMSVWSGGVSID